MSSINPHYTFQYSQPEAYRFSHDSVFLARRVFEMVRAVIRPEWRVLDLCSGTGIVGLDFMFHCRSELGFVPHHCDFLELQSDYETHFAINLARFNEQLGIKQESLTPQIRFLQQNYNEKLSEKYELILCNPPYFQMNEGKLSPNLFKNRCRFFMDATVDELLQTIACALAPQGQAFVLSRKPHHFVHPRLLQDSAGEIRGTPLLRYQVGFAGHDASTDLM